jgi:hypothetical protein
LLGGGWYYSGVIEDVGFTVDREPHEFEVEVVAIDAKSITLKPPDTDHFSVPTAMGLATQNAYARIDGILAADGSHVTRGYAPVNGQFAVGDMARYDAHAYPIDPDLGLGMAFETVTYNAPLGPLEAWLSPSSFDANTGRETWVIYVHGVRSEMTSGLRLMPPVAESGATSFVISYRNHENSPDDPSGRYGYGLTEWEDVHAAAQYALDNGADDLVIAGWSMGGGIVVSFMYRSPLVDRVSAVILDSPMLSFEKSVDWGGKQRNLPDILTQTAKWIAHKRFDIAWDELDYLASVDRLDVPVLLFHGDADETVPVATSDQLADERPDIVTYLRFDGAPHVGNWNADPERYEAAIRDFLANVLD